MSLPPSIAKHFMHDSSPQLDVQVRRFLAFARGHLTEKQTAWCLSWLHENDSFVRHAARAGNERELIERFRADGQRQGIQEHISSMLADDVLTNRQTVFEGGTLEPPPAPSLSEDEKLIEDRQALMRSDPEKHYGSSSILDDLALHDAYARREVNLAEVRTAPPSAAPAAPKVSASSWAPTTARDDPGRKIEIQTLLKTNYNEYCRQNLGEEYGEIVSRETPTPTEDQ